MFYSHINLEYLDAGCEEISFDPLNPAKTNIKGKIRRFESLINCEYLHVGCEEILFDPKILPKKYRMQN